MHGRINGEEFSFDIDDGFDGIVVDEVGGCVDEGLLGGGGFYNSHIMYYNMRIWVCGDGMLCKELGS